MQRETTELAVENKELKLRLQAMDQQAQLRDGMHVTSSLNALHCIKIVLNRQKKKNQNRRRFMFIFRLFTDLSEALKEEVQRLRIAAGQVPLINGNPFNRPPQYPSSRPPVHHFSSSHAQQGQQQPSPSLATNLQQPDPKWMNSSQLLGRNPDGQAKP